MTLAIAIRVLESEAIATINIIFSLTVASELMLLDLHVIF